MTNVILLDVDVTPQGVYVTVKPSAERPIDMYASEAMTWDEAEQYRDNVVAAYNKFDAAMLSAGFSHPTGRDNVFIKNTGDVKCVNPFSGRNIYTRNGETVDKKTLILEAESFAREANEIAAKF